MCVPVKMRSADTAMEPTANICTNTMRRWAKSSMVKRLLWKVKPVQTSHSGTNTPANATKFLSVTAPPRWLPSWMNAATKMRS